MMPAYSLILTYRNTSDHRERNLYKVIHWYADLDQTEIILVEISERPTLDKTRFPERCRYFFLKSNAPFNKSLGHNQAAKVALGHVCAFVDSDMLLPVASMRRSLYICAVKFDAVNPYENLVDLSIQESNEVCDDKLSPETVTRLYPQSNRSEIGEIVCFCGGVFIMKKSVFFDIGGMDTRFLGWGGEDDAMSIKVNRKLSNIVTHKGFGYHLWHDRALTIQDNYARNCQMVAQYQSMDNNDFDQFCREQSQILASEKMFLVEI